MTNPKKKSKKVHTHHDPKGAIPRSLALVAVTTIAAAAKPEPDLEPTSIEFSPAIQFRAYQEPVFRDRQSGILVLHWSRQIGKSFTLAAWAVDRLITRPGRLVTVLSNSRENGAEFLAKCVEICNLNRTRHETVDKSQNPFFEAMRLELHIPAYGKLGRIKILAANPRTARGFSGDLILDEFAFHENSAAIWEAVEPILSSNPDYLCRIASTGNGKHNLFYRLAAPSAEPASAERGVQSAELTQALIPEPVSLEPSAMAVDVSDFQSGISNLELSTPPDTSNSTESTVKPVSVKAPLFSSPSPPWGRGRGEGESHDQPEKLLSPHASPPENSALRTPHSALPRGGICLSYSQTGFILSRVTRTQAHWLGVKIYDPRTRQNIEPATARAAALDKRAYDQNYECSFADENLTLLSHELINAAEHDGVGEISEQNWTATQLANLHAALGALYVGFDVARKADLSVITVLEKLGDLFYLRAVLRIQDMRLPDQQLRLGEICRLPQFQRAAIDMTGLGLGLFEYAQNEFGSTRIHGINFATTVPATRAVQQEGRKRETVRVTEALALELLQTYEDRRIRQPVDTRLRDDLRKPERVTTPGGRVSIAATRDEAGHADHFWSLALALEAAATASGPFAYQPLHLHTNQQYKRTSLI